MFGDMLSKLAMAKKAKHPMMNKAKMTMKASKPANPFKAAVANLAKKRKASSGYAANVPDTDNDMA